VGWSRQREVLPPATPHQRNLKDGQLEPECTAPLRSPSIPLDLLPGTPLWHFQSVCSAREWARSSSADPLSLERSFRTQLKAAILAIC
jgi:hypothetical protein